MNVLEIAPPPLEDFLVAGPVLVAFLVACLGVLIEALAPRALRFVLQASLAALGLVGAFGLLILNWQAERFRVIMLGSLMVDGPTYFAWAMLLVFTTLALMVFAERRLTGGTSAFAASAAATPGSPAEEKAIAAKLEHAEIFPLAFFAVTGMLVFPAANDLVTLFIALEVLSLPLYLMSGLARRRRLLSQEAALKYFLLGATSSAFMLFGIALLFGYAGSFDLARIAQAIAQPVNGNGLLIAGSALVAIGLLFKVGAVPFHSWTPDVYAGAPTPVTGFMAVCTKIAAVMALLRVLFMALGADRWNWQPVLAVIAVLTMVIGSVIAVVQTDIKRLLAYSSIAHAGFILTAVVGASTDQTGLLAGSVGSVGAVMFYLVAYGFATIGAFAVVTLVRNAGGEVTAISGWAGLGRKSPFLAGVFTLFLLSFAGIPLTGGFIGKVSVFAAAWAGGYWWLVVVAVVMSLVTAFFYLRIVVVMFFNDPDPAVEIGDASGFTWVPIIVGAVATIGLGVVPGSVLELATAAAGFLIG